MRKRVSAAWGLWLIMSAHLALVPSALRVPGPTASFHHNIPSSHGSAAPELASSGTGISSHGSTSPRAAPAITNLSPTHHYHHHYSSSSSISWLVSPSSTAPSRRLSTANAGTAGPRAPYVPAHPRLPAEVRDYLEAVTTRPEAVIPVVFIIMADPEDPATNVTKQQVEQQMALLQEAFSTGLPPAEGQTKVQPLWRFKLEGIHWTSTSSPLCYGRSEEEPVKKRWQSMLLKQAPSLKPLQTLIIYSSPITSNCRTQDLGFSSLFGYSNSPQDARFWVQYDMTFLDGVVVDPGSFPGGILPKVPGKQTGVQVVHEVGHWMGLMHTFAGGCVGNVQYTDQILDTPAEDSPAGWPGGAGDFAKGCKARDSCPSLPGRDLYTNYMSYYNHACADSFTAGQQARMLYMWRQYRSK